jgi:tetratricopeptide (TPR) repeat protein
MPVPARRLRSFGVRANLFGAHGSARAYKVGLCWMFALLMCQAGCSSLARRWQRDDVISARQIAQRGMDAVDAGDWTRAEEHFAKAVEVCPVDERVRWRYADALWVRGARSEAIEHMREAVRLSGGAPELLVRLAEMHFHQGNLVQAKHLADRVIRSGRPSAPAYRLRGDVQAHEGRWRAALAAYHRALSIQADYPEVQMAVGRVYQRHGRPQRALSTLQALSETYAPGQEPPELLFWEGLAYASLGRHESAVACLSEAESRGFRSADLLYQLAESRFLSGDAAAAQLALQRALEADPHHVAAGRLGESIRHARQLASARE